MPVGIKADRAWVRGEATLVEHTEHDGCWADGGDGSGRSRLGELLMQVRSELREDGAA